MPADVDPRRIRPFVDQARHRLALWPWKEVEIELARNWARLADAANLPWPEVADDIRRAALEEMHNP